MDFASNYAYTPMSEEAVEVIDGDDLDDGLARGGEVSPCSGSDEEVSKEPEGGGILGGLRRGFSRLMSKKTMKKRPTRTAGAPRTVFKQKADTNVLALRLGELVRDASIASGDPTHCTKCKAVLSTLSTLKDHTGKVVFGGKDGSAVEAAAAPVGAPLDTVEEKAGEGEAAPDPAAATVEPKVEPKPEGVAAPDPALETEKTEKAEKKEGEPESKEGGGGGGGGGRGGEVDPADMDEDDLRWDCEFCGTINIVQLDEEEFPKSGSMDYIIEAAPAAAVIGGGGEAAMEDTSAVLFVIDTSGSMCVTTEMAGVIQLKGDRRKKEMEGLLGLDDGDQFIPGQRRDVTYVSRLQAVQAAVTSQIEELKRVNPTKRVGLVTFNGDVTWFGDGSSDTKVIAGEKLKDGGALRAEAASLKLAKSVSDGADDLTKRIYDLEETGPTALGPAILIANEVASRKAGSKVILCTDGLANVGLGSLEDDRAPAAEALVADAIAADVAADEAAAPGDDTAAADDDDDDDDDVSAAVAFYKELGLSAKAKGVTIDVVGIEGEGCDLEVLGQMTDASNGTVELVNPAKLSDNFAHMLENPALATSVTAKLLLHQHMELRGDDDGALGSSVERVVGTVKSDTEITFEYGQKPGADVSKIRALPFQVVITYTKLNGMKCIRVISKAQATTTDRAVAEKDVAIELMSAHTSQKAAKLASRGEYHKARLNTFAMRNVMKRSAATEKQRAAYSHWMADMSSLDDAVQSEMMDEIEMGYDESRTVSSKKGKKSVAKSRFERRRGKDGFSSVLHRMKQTSSMAYTPIPRPAASAPARAPPVGGAPPAAALATPAGIRQVGAAAPPRALPGAPPRRRKK